MTEDVAQEIGQIEGLMRTDRAAYNRDVGMQERLRSLYEAQEGSAATEQRPALSEATQAAMAGDALVDLMPLAEWERAGGDAAGHREHVAVVREVNDLLSGTDDADRAAMADSFAALPGEVHDAVFAELASRRAVASFPFDAEDMAGIRKSSAWTELEREWGGLAPEKFGVLRARLDRVFARLPDPAYEAAIEWLEAAPHSTLVALGRKLAR